jgi:flagella basal body P-ring formation protein FlgA
MRGIKSFLFLALIGLPLISLAETKPTVIGKKESTIIGGIITLGDIAEITSDSETDKGGLSLVKIGDSPAPGESSIINASTILAAIKSAGVNLADIGYVFTETITVTRAARLITLAEVRDAIEREIEADGSKISISAIDYRDPVKVAPGFASISAALSSRGRSKMKFGITVAVTDEAPKTFEVQVKVADWADIPVASRPLRRGQIIDSSDLQMARVNLETLAEDVAINESDLIGKELKQNISTGETFRDRNIKVPPVILSSSKVTAVYESGPLKAIATGIALEDGITGQVIRVQNEISKKILMARVVEPGLVKIEREVLR